MGLHDDDDDNEADDDSVVLFLIFTVDEVKHVAWEESGQVASTERDDGEMTIVPSFSARLTWQTMG